jgi:hypothetical protein
MHDLEQMCRDHFNEPAVFGLEIGRVIGYAEDDHDCYVIVKFAHYPEGRIVYHSCVGGYVFLERLRKQDATKMRDGRIIDDLDRLDTMLALNGAPRVESFLVKTLPPCEPPAAYPAAGRKWWILRDFLTRSRNS